MKTNYSAQSALIGKVLMEAGLISETQLHDALFDQAIDRNRRIGEILALRGYIQQKTADFFAERFEALIDQDYRLPIGQYLSQAGLLNQEQINVIIRDQELNHMRFGATAMLKGFISQQTLDFFLSNLGAQVSSKGNHWRGSQKNGETKSALSYEIQALARKWLEQHG